MNRAAWALLILGLIQMTGDLLIAAGADALGRPIKGIGAATTASPAPKVFTAVRGLETFSTQFVLEWVGRDGLLHEEPLTSERYARLRGPYNRRNVFGAVLAYGPILITTEATRPMFESVRHYALEGDAPILGELGIDPGDVVGPLRVRYLPRPGTPTADWPRVIETSRR